MICNECETVAHCAKHGCIPKQSAQRTWVGLTDEEAIFLIENELLGRCDLIEAIEAKLREKNT